MKRLKRQFQGLYWRQLYVTAGTVMLTLLLLGASFFALSYNYARNQRSDEIIAQAKVMSQLSVSYLETGRYLRSCAAIRAFSSWRPSQQWCPTWIL